METTRIVEALLFASEAPLTAAELARADDYLDEDAVERAIQALRSQYDASERAFKIYELAGGYQILTRPEYAPYLERFASVPQSGRLSGAALEVLAVIAYRQPIGRSEIEDIRGVSSAGVLRTLQDRGLIDVVGRGDGLGRPLFYGTTTRFLEHFGFNTLHDLPRPEELPIVLGRTGAENGPASGAVPAAAGIAADCEPAADPDSHGNGAAAAGAQSPTASPAEAHGNGVPRQPAS